MTVPTGLTNAAMAGYLSCLVMRQNPRHAMPRLYRRFGNHAIADPENFLKSEITRSHEI
jgi:hypothetical protein